MTTVCNRPHYSLQSSSDISIGNPVFCSKVSAINPPSSLDRFSCSASKRNGASTVSQMSSAATGDALNHKPPSPTNNGSTFWGRSYITISAFSSKGLGALWMIIIFFPWKYRI